MPNFDEINKLNEVYNKCFDIEPIRISDNPRCYESFENEIKSINITVEQMEELRDKGEIITILNGVKVKLTQ